MKVLIGSVVIFFGTLLAAGLVALGQPSAMDAASHASPSGASRVSSQAAADDDAAWERLFAIRGLR